MGSEASTMKPTNQQLATKRRFLNPQYIRNYRTMKKECELLGNELISLNNVHRNPSFITPNSHGSNDPELARRPYLRCISSA